MKSDYLAAYLVVVSYILCVIFAWAYVESREARQIENPIIIEYGPKRFDIKEFEQDMEKAGYYCPNKESNPREWVKR